MTALQQANVETRGLESSIAMPLRAACFAVLGALTARQAGLDPLNLLGGALGGVAFQAVGLGVMVLLLWAFNPGARKQHGMGGMSSAVDRGFILLLPFTVLAALADLALGWNAVQAFASAGIMSSGAAVGAELGKLGGGRLRSMLLPTGWCFVLTMVWVVAGSMAMMLLRSLT